MATQKVLNIEGHVDTFTFWAKNLRREKPYIKIKNLSRIKKESSHSVIVYSVNQDELDYLENLLFVKQLVIDELEKEDKDKYQITSIYFKILAEKKQLSTDRRRIEKLKTLDPKGITEIITFYDFKEILFSFNKKALDRIIDGETLDLGNHLGHLRILKYKTPNSSIDWPKSKAKKEELIAKGVKVRTKGDSSGTNWFVYRFSDFKLKWNWLKFGYFCLVKNNRLFKFQIASSKKQYDIGGNHRLTQALKKNKLLHLKYYAIETSSEYFACSAIKHD